MFEVDRTYEIIGKIESINQGQHFLNMTVLTLEDKHVNIKFNDRNHNLELGKVYQFKVMTILKDEDEIVLKFVDAMPINKILDDDLLEKVLNKFYKYAPMHLKEIKTGIESFLNKIENEVLKNITAKIYNDNKEVFYMHPAATKFHHAYVGGLSYHTYTMLKLVEAFRNVYPYLNKDLLYAGTILHDMSKISEISGVDGEYTKEGLLLGHLVMQAIDVDRVALELGYQGTEEVLLLKHMIVSHHGQLNFGSPKKPQIGEALLLWFVDTIDSKFTVLGEELVNTNEGEFTSLISVLDKMRFYKPKL